MQSSAIDRITFSGLALVVLMLAPPDRAQAQGEGPKSYLLAPVGLNAVTFIYLDMASTMNFAGNILIPNAEIESDVGVVSYVHFFSVGSRFAQIWVNGIWGTVRGEVTVGEGAPPILPFPLGATVKIPSESGLADPYVAMRVGLVGAPALGLEEFMQYEQGFQMHALFGAYVPVGDYDGERPLNLGTNRWGLRFGVPMVLPIGNPARQFNWEIVPSVVFFTDNTDPYRADLREQDPLGMVESHLSRNFTKRFWGSLDLRYQYGGETATDGVSDDNRLGQLGGGVSLGYAFTRFFSCYGSYGEIVARNDDSEGDMIRARCTLSF